MKKIYTLIVVLMLAFSITPVTGAQAQAAYYYPNELAYIDAQVNLMLPLLDQFEADYFAVNSRYYQALVSHSSPPEVPEIPDGIYGSPTDQPESLAYFWEFAALPDTLAWALRIDTYSAPDGNGYVLGVETVIDGNAWARSVNYGPDTSRSFDWYPVTEE